VFRGNMVVMTPSTVSTPRDIGSTSNNSKSDVFSEDTPLSTLAQRAKI